MTKSRFPTTIRAYARLSGEDGGRVSGGNPARRNSSLGPASEGEAWIEGYEAAGC